MRNLKNIFKSNAGFLANVTIMVSGKSVAAAVALLTVPIVARLFDPDDFGVAASFSAIVAISGSVGSLRYSNAIILPRDDREATRILQFALIVATIVGCALLLAVTAHEISRIRIAPLSTLQIWAWLLPVGFLLASSIQIGESWCTRQKKFATISGGLVLGNVSTSGTRIAFGAVFGSSVSGLIIGELVGQSTRLTWLFRKSCRGIGKNSQIINKVAAVRIAKEYSDFPRYNAPAGLIFALGQNLPIVLFASLFTPAIAGFYAMANRLSQAPVTIVSTSIRGVFLQKAAELRANGYSISRAYALSTAGLATVGLGPFLLLAFFGQPLSSWLLGDNWSVAGGYLEIMVPWLFMVWVAAPCNGVFIALRQQALHLRLQILLTVLRIGAFGVAWQFSMGPEATLQAFSWASAGGIAVTMAFAANLVRQTD